MLKRLLSLLLCCAILAGYIPTQIFAEEIAQQGLCEHHTEHVDCGYVDGEAACEFVCDICTQEQEETTAPVTEETTVVCTGLSDCAAENHDDSCEKRVSDEKAAADQSAADAVATLIDSLPSLSEIKAKELEKQAEDYNQVQTAYGAYEKLAEDQKALLPSAEEVFKPYFDYFNSLALEAKDSEIVSGTCGDNLSWKFDEATGTLTVSGTGSMENFVRLSYAPWYWYDINIKSVVIQDGVTSIGSYAFYGCNKLTDITLPDGITYVGDCAFIDCSSLGNITIPDSVTWIGASAFAGCSSLTGIAIPDGVTKIGGSAFYGCSNLAYITIPDSVADIGSYVFADCSSLTRIAIPGRITRIDRNAFYNCTNLESITISDYVDSIEYEAFLNCSNLTSITLPNSVKYINTNAFRNCKSLASIVIPDNVAWIGACAFSNCSSLTSVIIPDSVTSIGDCAFSGCNNLINITISDSVTNISESAFRNCSSLAEVLIPEGVTSIDYAAFEGCSNLMEIVIPEGVTSIGGAAFQNSGNLTELFFMGDAPVIGDNTFYNVTATAYYPANNLTWTDTVMQHYGGVITWVPYTAEHIHEYDDSHKCECGTIGGTCGNNLTWMLDEKGTLTIMGTGEMFFGSIPPWNNYKDLITKVIVESGITCIDSFSFDRCTYLETVELPESLTWIREQSFAECTSLAEIILPEKLETIGARAFRGCTSLNSIIVPDGVRSIGSRSFAGCTNLTEIKLSKSLVSISPYTFSLCHNLTSIEIPAGVNSIGEEAFNNCMALKNVVIPAGTQIIGKGAFDACYSLQNVTISDGVTSIKDGAFAYCYGLDEITFLGDAPSFGSNVFKVVLDATAYYPADNATWTEEVCQNYGGTITWVSYSNEHIHEYSDKHVCECGAIGGTCGEDLTWVLDDNGTLTISGTGEMTDFDMSNNVAPWYELGSQITSIVVEDGVNSIGENAFAYLHCLSKITLPDSLTSISGAALYDCRTLTEIAIPENVTSIGHGVFYGCDELVKITVDEGNDNYESVDGILFNESLTVLICYPAMKAGTKYVIPDSVTEIRSSAFSFCTNLVNIDITDNVKTIGSNAFSYCSNIEEINISENVTSIGSGAFSGCYQLRNINVADDSTKYTSINGVLFNKACTILMCYPCGKNDISYVIPNSVTSLAAWAFNDCSGLTEIIIPDGVTFIGHGAFADCGNVQEMIIPSSVTQIVDYAFSGCDSLTSITFRGNAPTFGSEVFSYVTAISYYPRNNPTWTENKRQNYDGDITWVGYGNYSITIEDGITNGTVTSDKTAAQEGDVITLTVTPDPYFVVDRVAYQYGDAQNYLSANDDGTYSFIMPSEDVTVSAKFRYATHVSGIPINAENAHNVLGDGTVSYDLATNTMRLDGAVIEGSNINGSTVVYGIHSMRGLNIVLGEKTSIIQNCHEGIEVFGDLTISGGSLVIQDASTVGIWVYNDNLTINGSTITINMTPDGGHAVCAHKTSSTVIINSGKLELHAGKTFDDGRYGIGAHNIIVGNDAHIIATGGSGATYTVPKLAAGASGKSRTEQNADFSSGIVYNNEQYFEFIGDGVDHSGNKPFFAITQQPVDGEAVLGERYCVEVKATGEGLTYQWYFRNEGTTRWNKSSVTDSTYDDVMTKARADREVYCVITDAHGNKVTTDTVKLICLPGEKLAITSQPENASAKLNEKFCVTVEAQGDALKYQWYWRNVGSTEWSISGQKDNTYDDVMTSARHNREVYCVITDGWGNSVETETATITGIVTVPLAITRQPEGQTVMMGEMFNVTFDAVGDGLKYQWYFMNEGSDKWYKSAQKDNSYDDVMTEPRHSRSLYCIVTDAWGNTVNTEPVVVITATQRDKLAIIAQPEDASAKLCEDFCVRVEAQGDALKYQWYWRNKGSGNWNISGQRDNTYDDVMTKARNHREVKCVITDMWNNTVETEIATITGIPEVALEINGLSADVSVAAGERYCITVAAQGDDLTYTWYIKNAGSKTWSKSGVKDNTYDDVMTKARAGRGVYCVVTDALGNQVTTDVVTLKLIK